MKVSGEGAAAYQAVRLDSFDTVNQGVLLSADDETGEVVWRDRTGNEVKATLGQRAIIITPRHSLGR